LARKILLADDSVTAQNMGRRILSDAGYDVTTVNNGSAALKKIAESKPDLIVLDVYMPGYGGLEVCQRIRESQETARIPVLLTVGKLEPFKADEARRVRADAFIVKPFEASELLTALTKLEDKIVPQSQGYKPGRFAKAMAAADESSQKNEFGDVETGWKNRLKIPPPHHPKQHEAPGAAKTESPTVPSGLPGNITAEEIAAIQAAAAAFSSPSVETPAAQPTAEAAVVTQPEAPTQSQTPVAQETAESPTSPAQAEAIPSQPRDQTSEVPVIADTHAVSSDSIPESVRADQKAAHDEEVAAALASLAPANGDGAAATFAVENRDEQIPVTMAAAVATQEFSGPRWIAEPVQASEEESSLILEEEMRKALAAMAEMEHAPVEPPAMSEAAVANGTTGPETATVECASFAMESSSGAESQKPEEPTAVTPLPSAEPPTIVPETEAVVAVSPAAEVSTEVKEEAAYAAAASAGSANESAVSAEASALTPTEVTQSSAPVESVSREHEAELAAAWASWKQVRESVAAPQATSTNSDTSSSGFHEIHHAEPAHPESEAEAAEDSGAIASIVDSVLAELKPKLMQEIAKKMGKEKK